MLKFLRLPFTAHTETEEAFRLRMQRLQQDMDDLCQKQPGEVTGAPQEPVYYGLKFSQALNAGNQAEARHFLSEMLRVSPGESSIRLIASTAYAQLGDEPEAIAQLGIALGLRPENYAVHKHLAHLLMKRGEQETAAAILEKGWVYYRKHVSKSDQAARRSEYFSILENKQAV
jgi:predicted Zn-dependent protease